MAKPYLVRRRALLKGAGIAGVTALLNPLLRIGESLANEKKDTHRVGILIQGSADSQAARQYLEGVDLYLREHDHPFVPIIREAGSSGYSAQREFGKLCKTENVSAVLALMNTRVADWLHGVAEEAEVTIVESNLGDIATGLDHPRFVYRHSLHLWQSQYMFGRWAAQNLGKRAICAVSHLDSGNDILFAFSKGFVTGGGVVEQTIVTNASNHSITAQEAATIASRSDVPVVFAHFSGSEAEEFAESFFSHDRLGRRLLGSGMTMQQRALSAGAEGLDRVLSAHGYDPQGDTYQSFLRRYRSRFGTDASEFSLLGYEAAMMGYHLSRPGDIPDRLETPRGWITLDGERRVADGDVFVLSLTSQGAPRLVEALQVEPMLMHPAFRLTDELNSRITSFYPLT